MNQQDMPLFNQLVQFAKQNPISYHVPGHKNGMVFLEHAQAYFDSILPIDVTELTGLDDLHAPRGVIKEAQDLAAAYFGADHTFFLVGGSTVGNLAMILSVCAPGEKIIVQRNSHKSIMNGLELSGAHPIFISPTYNPELAMYTSPSFQAVKQAITEHPDAKGLVLTYPDYFGNTYAIKEMIDLAHQKGIPVLVDEAHGVHFSLGDPFPKSALALGADVVVQSAHKMAPAMTMASYLHIHSQFVLEEQIAHFLQILQSSSPSYPLMASLDIARSFLATRSKSQLTTIIESVQALKAQFQKGTHWDVLQSTDPLKIILKVKEGLSGFQVAHQFEKYQLYPELATDRLVLFIHGLAEYPSERVEKIVKNIKQQYKYEGNHATIELDNLFKEPVQELALTYGDMRRLPKKRVKLEKANGFIAAEAVIPYPPGIPVILKGERITNEQISLIWHLIHQGATMEHQDITEGVLVFE